MAGLSSNGKPHKVQEAFIAEQVPQCGYCMNGWVMTTVALLDKTPKPTDAQIEDALTGLKCRCATHVPSCAPSSARLRREGRRR